MLLCITLCPLLTPKTMETPGHLGLKTSLHKTKKTYDIEGVDWPGFKMWTQLQTGFISLQQLVKM